MHFLKHTRGIILVQNSKILHFINGPCGKYDNTFSINGSRFLINISIYLRVHTDIEAPYIVLGNQILLCLEAVDNYNTIA